MLSQASRSGRSEDVRMKTLPTSTINLINELQDLTEVLGPLSDMISTVLILICWESIQFKRSVALTAKSSSRNFQITCRLAIID